MEKTLEEMHAAEIDPDALLARIKILEKKVDMLIALTGAEGEPRHRK